MAATPPPREHIGLRRLFPDPGPIRPGDVLASLNLLGLAPVERPYTIANFVAGVDGRAAFHGRSRALSDPGDREMFHGLRERVDAVLVGTGTLRIERYGRLVRDPDRRRRRAASGLSPDPLACVITRSGDVPGDIPLFADAASRIILFTPAPIDTSQWAAQVEVVRLDPGELTLTTMVRRLRSHYDVRALLCEGGPTLFGALVQEDLVDELFLTLGPKLAGGGAAPTIASGPELADLRKLELRWVLEQHDSLYLRYSFH